MEANAKILITGGTGMVGSALLRQLLETHFTLAYPNRSTLNLCNQQQVFDYFNHFKPDYVFHLAAIVGGIHANATYPAKFIYDNTQMHCNVIEAALKSGVKKILFPGSACTYPKLATQPILETSLLSGMIEPTNLAYAAAKINGIIMCQSYAREHQLNAIVPMPTNAYGIGDNFSPQSSHVIPALMQRIHHAKVNNLPEVILWGSGNPLREFIYVDDLAEALIFLMQHYHDPEIINVGTMQEISIKALAMTIAKVIGYEGEIGVEPTKPDGAPRKCLDSSKLFALGFKPKTTLQEGLRKMYEHHQMNFA